MSKRRGSSRVETGLTSSAIDKEENGKKRKIELEKWC